MNICTVNCSLSDALAALGHVVLPLHPRPGLVSLPRLLEGKNFRPDLIVQQESLGRRVLLSDLDEVGCPAVFWSIDTHLNLWWHGLYGQAFDLVLTTQDHLVEPLAAMGALRSAHLPWYGSEQPFVPHAGRPRDMVFVGRETPARKVRTWMLDFLSERFDLERRQDVPGPEMVAACARGRLAPNETILGEINFRLFEAASAGCAVLTPAVDADTSRLFEPGREILVHHDALELEANVRRCLDHPSEAEAMGRAARERVLREHLPAHRAESLLRAAEGLTRSGMDRPRDAAWRRGALLAFEAGLVPLSRDTAMAMAAQRSDDPDLLAALVRLTAGPDDPARTAAVIDPLLAPGAPSSLQLDLAASMAALRLGRLDAARALLERRGGLRPDRRTRDRRDILLAWARLLEAAGHGMRIGFPFDPDVHLPATALNCLTLTAMDDMDEETARGIARLTGSRRGLEHMLLGALSMLALHRPDDWRAGLRLGLANLRAFRPGQGLADLGEALDKARRAGQEQAFMRQLARDDGDGRIRTALAARNHQPGQAP